MRTVGRKVTVLGDKKLKNRRFWRKFLAETFLDSNPLRLSWRLLTRFSMNNRIFMYTDFDNRRFRFRTFSDARKMVVIHAAIFGYRKKNKSVYRTSLNISPSPHPLDLSFSGNLHWLHGSVVHWKLLHGVLHTFVCTVSAHGRPPLVAFRSICGPKTRATRKRDRKRRVDDNATTDWHVANWSGIQVWDSKSLSCALWRPQHGKHRS